MSDTLYFLFMIFNLHNTNNISVQSGRKSPVRPSIIVNTYSTQRILDSAKEEGKHGIVHYERAPSLGELKSTSRTNSISDSIYKSASSFNKLEDASQNSLSKSDPTLNSHCDNSSPIYTKKTRSLPNLSRKSQFSQFNSLEKVDTTSLESVNEFIKEKDLKISLLEKENFDLKEQINEFKNKIQFLNSQIEQLKSKKSIKKRIKKIFFKN